jgi:hypothetical protein
MKPSMVTVAFQTTSTAKSMAETFAEEKRITPSQLYRLAVAGVYSLLDGLTPEQIQDFVIRTEAADISTEGYVVKEVTRRLEGILAARRARGEAAANPGK